MEIVHFRTLINHRSLVQVHNFPITLHSHYSIHFLLFCILLPPFFIYNYFSQCTTQMVSPLVFYHSCPLFPPTTHNSKFLNDSKSFLITSEFLATAQVLAFIGYFIYMYHIVLTHEETGAQIG